MSVFLNIDPPSNTGFTETFGINSSGQIVGYYENPQRHGFLYSGGTYTTLDVPMASLTEANGINDLGHIVGVYQDSGFKYHGYIYRNGTYSTLDDPLGTSETIAQGVNNADQVVGIYKGTTGPFHGFFVDPALGLYAPIDDPLASTSYTGTEGTYAQDINNAHQIVGYYVDAPNRHHGFLYANGNYTTLDVPGASLTRALGPRPDRRHI